MPSPTSPIRSASRASFATLAVLLAVGACSAGATAAPTVAPSVPATSPSPTAVPTAAGSTSSAQSPSPSAAPTTSSGPSACVTGIAAGIAPSDRLTGVAVASGVGVDKIVFTFGPTTGIPSGTDPTGEVKPTAPPFMHGGSGEPVHVDGQRYVAVTFRGQAVADEQGNPSYTGPSDIKPNALAVRELLLVDNFEGVVTWLVGVDGPGCVAVSRLTAPDRIVVSVVQP